MSGTRPGPNGGEGGGAAGEGNGGYDPEMASLAKAFSKANAGRGAGNDPMNALAAGVSKMGVRPLQFGSNKSAFRRRGKEYHCDFPGCGFTASSIGTLHIHGRSHADKITSLNGTMGSGGGGAGAAAGGAGAAAGGAGAGAAAGGAGAGAAAGGGTVGGWGGEEPPGGNGCKSRKTRKSRKGRKSRKTRKSRKGRKIRKSRR